jgi:ParB-like chromosome segregation protein Spo0J
VSRLPEAFKRTTLALPLARLLPSRILGKDIQQGRKFAQIRASMQEIGLIEPLVVAPAPSQEGCYTVLDGHLRLQVARELGLPSLLCLCAKDDEAYTYNKRVSRLATVQEHYMILRALERGVPEERLAKALDVNVDGIRRRRDLLNGICPEVVEMLKNANFAADIMRLLRRMKPARQIECAELMLSLNSFSISYATALLAATPTSQLVEPEKPKRLRGLTGEQIRRMEEEMSLVESRFKSIEQSYNSNVMHLVLARGYLGKLLGNAAVASWLQRHQPELHDEFRGITATQSLDDAAGLG